MPPWIHKSIMGLAPFYLQNMFQYRHHGHCVKLRVPSHELQYGRRSFSIAGPRLLNCIPQYIIDSENVSIFKSKLKTYLFQMNDDRLMNM